MAAPLHACVAAPRPARVDGIPPQTAGARDRGLGSRRPRKPVAPAALARRPGPRAQRRVPPRN
eukprot:4283470-Pleurochrysis_carterae.AAC.1